MLRSNFHKLPFAAACLWAFLLLSPAAAQEADSLTEAPAIEMAEDEVVVDVEEDEEDNDEPFLFRTQTRPDSLLVSARTVRETDLAKFKKDEDFWYVNEAPKREVPRKASSFKFFEKAWFKTLMWILVIGGFLVILIWFLLSSNVQLFHRKSAVVDGGLQGEEGEENIFEIDYDAEIRKAVAGDDLRLAIRLHYLRLLKDLSQKGVIQYSQGSTNSDYVLQLYGKPYGADFFRLTRSFEYAWYGQFPISKEAFSAIETQFSNLRNRLVA